MLKSEKYMKRKDELTEKMNQINILQRQLNDEKESVKLQLKKQKENIQNQFSIQKNEMERKFVIIKR